MIKTGAQHIETLKDGRHVYINGRWPETSPFIHRSGERSSRWACSTIFRRGPSARA